MYSRELSSNTSSKLTLYLRLTVLKPINYNLFTIKLLCSTFYVGSSSLNFNFFNKLKRIELLLFNNNNNICNNNSFLYFFDGFFFPFNTHQGLSLRYFNLNFVLNFKKKKIQKKNDFYKKYNVKLSSPQNKFFQNKNKFNVNNCFIKPKQNFIKSFFTGFKKKNKFKFKKRRFWLKKKKIFFFF